MPVHKPTESHVLAKLNQSRNRPRAGSCQVSPNFATIEYDALGLRIAKDIDNSGDWNCTDNYYWNDRQTIEFQ